MAMTPDALEPIVVPEHQTLALEVQQQIERLQRPYLVELAAVQQFYLWLDDKRHSRQSSRVIGDSRTGKTFAC